MIVHVCPSCQKIYRARKNRQIYCSARCRDNTKIHDRLTIICKNCQKSFKTRWPVTNKNKPQIFCSPECHRAYYRVKQERECLFCERIFMSRNATNLCCSDDCKKKQIIKTLRRKRVEGDCRQCGQHFISRLTVEYCTAHPELTPTLCSKQCMFASRRVDKVKVSCQECGKERLVFPSDVEYGRGLFCSKKCAGKGLSRNYSGENNHHWKGDRATNRRFRTDSQPYRKYRKAILERDNYTCVECGSKEKLEVDHIKPKYLYPELVYEISNGRTLCHDCHQSTPTYGLNRMTREQFEML